MGNPIIWLFEDFSTLQFVGLSIFILGLIIIAAATSGYSDPSNTFAVQGATYTIIASGVFSAVGLLIMFVPRFYRNFKYRKLA